jgi:hypothetical protein
MAHLRDCTRQCSSSGCPKTATVTLYNNRNAEMGHYCATHGKQALKRQEGYETRDAQAS